VVEVHPLNTDQLLARLAEFTDLYAVVYAEPPYEEGPEQAERFRTHLADDAGRDGFTVVAAVDDTATGLAYGWTMPAGVWWSRADTDPPPEIRDVDKFAVMEWIVHPRYRGQGIGAKLIRALLADRPESFATLASDPRSAARSMYTRAGWRQVGTSTLPWGPPMDLLVLDLPISPEPS
jgi:GNAT superfamily N-acetyltransferase